MAQLEQGKRCQPYVLALTVEEDKEQVRAKALLTCSMGLSQGRTLQLCFLLSQKTMQTCLTWAQDGKVTWQTVPFPEPFWCPCESLPGRPISAEAGFCQLSSFH